MATFKASNTLLYNIYEITTSGFRSGNWWFGIYKGAVPTSSEISSNIRADLFRASDLLIPWNGFTEANMASISNGQMTLNPTGSIAIRTATATGTASWFLYAGGTVSAYYMSACTAVAGTVSSPGGGGDLIIGDVNIVTGKSYILQNFVMAFPLTF